ncbi:MAG: Hsp20/alpha crystallin family protein [Planctomycetes bacterium]|nr:Hsp20/alpha crystallin family protein [Planctomycetota bacterium]
MRLIPWKGKRQADLARDGSAILPSLASLRQEMDRLFSRFFDDPWGVFDTSLASFSGWTPTLDVIDGEKEVRIRAEIPGVEPNDVEVSISGNTLTISGEKKSEREEKGKDFHRSERHFGSFRRSVPLPDGVDAEKVSAEYANGVLTIRLAKSKAAAPKRIAVTKK